MIVSGPAQQAGDGNNRIGNRHDPDGCKRDEVNNSKRGQHAQQRDDERKKEDDLCRRTVNAASNHSGTACASRFSRYGFE